MPEDLDAGVQRRKGRRLLVFAHVPPPDHGQSRMVAEMLKALEEAGRPGFVHVDARVSGGIEDVGGLSIQKLFLLLGYLSAAVKAWFFSGSRVLYYVPGPVKWSAVVRDWMALAVLRLIFRRVVFHWHAIGQGEWAYGTERVGLKGPSWVEHLARGMSRIVLRKPTLSIVVSPKSDADARAVGSGRIEVVCNGIEDPCPDFESEVLPARKRRSENLKARGCRKLKILFLSRGTEEKGLWDALDALVVVGERLPVDGLMEAECVFAGGIEEGLEDGFLKRTREIKELSDGKLVVKSLGYVGGPDKARCFSEADLFLAPSRWESFGLTVAEAMAWGLPVVASASDGVRGVLPGKYRWMVPPADAGALGDVLMEACQAVCGGEGLVVGLELRKRFLDCFLVDCFRRRIGRVLGEVRRDRK